MESLMSVLGMHAYLVFKATGGILAMPLLETTPVLAKVLYVKHSLFG